jgi:SOS-response transcriptional repressor LexA
LTTKQHEILVTLDGYAHEQGFPPTLREMGLLGGGTVSNVHWHLTHLRDMGLVTWVNGCTRTLTITPLGRKAL